MNTKHSTIARTKSQSGQNPAWWRRRLPSLCGKAMAVIAFPNKMAEVGSSNSAMIEQTNPSKIIGSSFQFREATNRARARDESPFDLSVRSSEEVFNQLAGSSSFKATCVSNSLLIESHFPGISASNFSSMIFSALSL